MSTKTGASRAYEHLRDKLISGEFDPGQRLLYGPIGKEIGVSATPVREAAARLANEGLVDLVPQLGAVVRRMDREELIEIYEVRLAIEPYAAQLAAERADSDQLREIKVHLERMNELTAQHKSSGKEFAGKRMAGQFDKADFSFHMAIIEATGNRAMVRTAGQSHVLTRVFGVRRHRYDARSMTVTCRDHAAIHKAIRARNPEEASAAAAAHIRNGLEKSLQAIKSETVEQE